MPGEKDYVEARGEKRGAPSRTGKGCLTGCRQRRCDPVSLNYAKKVHAGFFKKGGALIKKDEKEEKKNPARMQQAQER